MGRAIKKISAASLLIVIIYCLLLPRAKFVLFPILYRPSVYHFAGQIKNVNNFDTQQFWKFRDLSNYGTVEFNPQGLTNNKTFDELVYLLDEKSSDHIKDPFMVYRSRRTTSIESFTNV